MNEKQRTYKDTLSFIFLRLLVKYREKENVDYMLNFKEAIENVLLFNDSEDYTDALNKQIVKISGEKKAIIAKYDALEKSHKMLISHLDGSDYVDKMFVPIFERDCAEPCKNHGSIMMETYTAKSSINDALETVNRIGDKYGKGTIFQLLMEIRRKAT